MDNQQLRGKASPNKDLFKTFVQMIANAFNENQEPDQAFDTCIFLGLYKAGDEPTTEGRPPIRYEGAMVGRDDMMTLMLVDAMMTDADFCKANIEAVQFVQKAKLTNGLFKGLQHMFNGMLEDEELMRSAPSHVKEKLRKIYSDIENRNLKKG